MLRKLAFVKLSIWIIAYISLTAIEVTRCYASFYYLTRLIETKNLKATRANLYGKLTQLEAKSDQLDDEFWAKLCER